MSLVRLTIAALASAGLACSAAKTPISDPETRVDASAVDASSETGALEDAGAKPNCAAGMPDSCPDGCVGQNARVPGVDGGCAVLVKAFCGVQLGGVSPGEVCVIGQDGGVAVFPQVETDQGLNGGRTRTQDENEQTREWRWRVCE